MPVPRLTEANERSLLLRLPLEIRIMIYEYAVYVKDPSYPLQAAKRSNQFTMGLPCYNPCFKERWKLPTVSQLTLSCSRIHDDLEENCTFYKVTTFKFMGLQYFITFLAALTDKKRSSIKYVMLDMSAKNGSSIQYNLRSIDWDEYIHSAMSVEDHTNAAALLQQCTSLRDVTCVFDFGTSQQTGDQLKRFLEMVENGASLPCTKTPSFWNIPVVDFLIRFHHDRSSVKLTEATDDSLNRDLPQQDLPLIDSFKSARDALIRKRECISEEYQKLLGIGKEEFDSPAPQTKLQMMKQLVSPHDLHKAIATAPLDFPGEDRMTLDKFNSSINSSFGSISSRTRQQRKMSRNVNGWGVIKPRVVGKYDAEGLITPGLLYVEGMRFHEGKYQCKTDYDSRTSGPTVSDTWDDLESLFSPHGLRALKTYYQHVFDGTIEEKQLEEPQDLPTPRRILEMARGWLIPQTGRDRVSWKATERNWNSLQTEYDAYVARL